MTSAKAADVEDVVLGDGTGLRLDGRGAALLADPRTLLVADLHLNKAGVLRRAGLAVPDAHEADLRRLDALVRDHGPRRLCVLGDLFHARPAPGDEGVRAAFAAFRAAHRPLELVLVAGNHDRRAQGEARAWGFDAVVPELWEAGLRLRHDDEGPQHKDGHVICGHLHPVVRLAGPGRDRLTAPCFWLRRESTVLPSFGRLTGGFRIRPGPGDRVWVAWRGRLRPAAL